MKIRSAIRARTTRRKAGETNPFLHLMMHLTIEEQISIDQPPGIRAHFQRLTEHYQSEHDAQHKMMECLGEMLWQAQRNGTGPDAGLLDAWKDNKSYPQITQITQYILF